MGIYAMAKLTLGSKGESVRLLQKGLSAFTKKDNILSTYDGIFGITTQEVLKQYQKENDLPITGEYDEHTQEVLGPLIDYMFIKIADIDEIALINDIHPAALKAVYSVESKGDGFLPKGYPVILYEGHIFYKYYLAEYGKHEADVLAQRYPSIVYKQWTSAYYKGGMAEYSRYNAASLLNEKIAKLSTSYGLFQVMGFNYRRAGYSSLDSYVAAMHESEHEQLKAGVSFIRSNSAMFEALQRLDWPSFAKYYNGAGYARNSYHIRLARSYQSWLQK